jgi:hypothetical protein
MSQAVKIITVTPENIKDHPQAVCFINPANRYYHQKVEWYSEQYNNGLRIKLLFVEGEKRSVGYIEYTPGEQCWRPVAAKGYMFIHCLWIYGKKHQHKGLGGMLITDAEREAAGMNGVAVVTSDNSFMARKDIFLKNGYRIVSESGKDQLLVKTFREATLPTFTVRAEEAHRYDAMTIIYSRQCPWVARFMEEMKPALKAEKLSPEVIEIRTAEEAQRAPSAYGVFNMIWHGTIIADRYISTRRLSNIIRKEAGREKPGDA